MGERKSREVKGASIDGAKKLEFATGIQAHITDSELRGNRQQISDEPNIPEGREKTAHPGLV